MLGWSMLTNRRLVPLQALMAWYADETGLAPAVESPAASAGAVEEPQRPRDARLRTPPKPCGAVRVRARVGFGPGFPSELVVRIRLG